jgi:biotin operon repressor
LDWEWYDDINTKVLFLHLLLKANREDKKWKGYIIKKGQLLTGRKKLATQLGISQQNIRTAITHLKSTNEITIESTKEFSIITINNWESYQQPTNKLTNNQPTSNQPLTTNNNQDNQDNINTPLPPKGKKADKVKKIKEENGFIADDNFKLANKEAGYSEQQWFALKEELKEYV